MYRGNHHTFTINGKPITVDSNLEERVIRWLNNNGYAEQWERPEYGATVGNSNYTPDLLLSIQLDNMTHIAIVEIKPSLDRFTDDVSRRMRAVAKHYYSGLLLLYCGDKPTWHRIDIKTGALTLCNQPTPGLIPITKLHRARTKRARSVFNHSYQTHHRPIAALINFCLDILQGAITGPKKRRRRT